MSRTASGSLFIALLAVAACSSTPPKTILTATTPTVAPESASPPQGPAVVATSPPAAHATASDAAGSQGGGVSVPGMAHGNLGFRDQVSAGRTLVGLAEIDGSGGWVVVREDRAGAPGRVLGSVYRANEAHDDLVTVRLQEQVETGPLWVSLHVDAGVLKRLEFPGPDQPIQFAGADLAHRLLLTVR
jgi:hypothetical protein